MKKIIILLICSLALSGCSFVNNYIENTVGVSRYRSDVNASLCEVENKRCSSEIKKYYSLMIWVKEGKYISYMHDAGSYFYMAANITKERIDQEIVELNRFISWASLNKDSRAKIDFKLDDQSPFILYVSDENIPYLAKTNVSKGFTSETVRYMLLDKENVMILLKELITIKYTHFNDNKK